MNVQLQAELTATKARVVEVERRKMALKTNYASLCSDFNDLQAANVAHVREKENVEKVECVKAQRFHNPLRKKRAGLRFDMEQSVAALGGQCLDFPATNATVGSMLDWFQTEVQAIPTAFAGCNQNITCFAVAGVLRMLTGVQCGHMLKL
jgi:hypothetical protein